MLTKGWFRVSFRFNRCVLCTQHAITWKIKCPDAVLPLLSRSKKKYGQKDPTHTYCLNIRHLDQNVDNMCDSMAWSSSLVKNIFHSIWENLIRKTKSTAWWNFIQKVALNFIVFFSLVHFLLHIIFFSIFLFLFLWFQKFHSKSFDFVHAHVIYIYIDLFITETRLSSNSKIPQI